MVNQWGKRAHKHCASIYRRTRSAQLAMAAGSHLRRLFTPAKLAMIGSFLLCFVIVMTPPRFLLQGSIMAGLASGGRERIVEMTNVKPLEPPQQAAVPPSSYEGSDRDANVELAELLTGEAPQLKEQLQETPKRNLFNRDHVREVQQRLIQLGYLSVSATGVWGRLSRKALRTFKSDHDLTADENWDEATERSLFSGDVEQAAAFVGIWGIDASACSPRLNRKGFLPAVIGGEGAWAGETFCTFERKKRIASGWDVVANCSNTHDHWTANVRLIINGNQLTWTSERGSVSYLRCQPGLGVARSL
jgi:peptidoglycan hydrolase-like protein with peptidoglycan-binding domain